MSKYDVIGRWSEIKLTIIRKYALAYSRIVAGKKFFHIYIDAFAGMGVHVSKSTGEFIEGSPLRALEVSPAFSEYHFVDLDPAKVKNLRKLSQGRTDVFIYQATAMKFFLRKSFPEQDTKTLDALSAFSTLML